MCYRQKIMATASRFNSLCVTRTRRHTVLVAMFDYYEYSVHCRLSFPIIRVLIHIRLTTECGTRKPAIVDNSTQCFSQNVVLFSMYTWAEMRVCSVAFHDLGATASPRQLILFFVR